MKNNSRDMNKIAHIPNFIQIGPTPLGQYSTAHITDGRPDSKNYTFLM